MHFLERSFDGNSQWGKYLFVALVSLNIGQILGGFPLMIVLSAASDTDAEVTANSRDLSVLGIDSYVSLFLYMIPFLASLVIFLLLTKALHHRTWQEVVNGTTSMRWDRFFAGALIWGLLLVIYYATSIVIDPSNFEMQFSLQSFLLLSLVSLIFIPIQTSYEELLFRGYLSQWCAYLTKNRWLVIVLPSILFALLHSFNPEVEKFGFWMMMPQYLTIGLIFAIASVLDDGIEIAMGAHAINNILLSLFFTYSDSALPTDAVFKQLHVDPTIEFIALIVMGFLFLTILGRKYQWNAKIIGQPIEVPASTKLE